MSFVIIFLFSLSTFMQQPEFENLELYLLTIIIVKMFKKMLHFNRFVNFTPVLCVN